MPKVLVTEAHLQDIANAIRRKAGSVAPLRPGDMAAAIADIEAGYPEPSGTLAITANGTVNVKDYASANVNVQPSLQSKTVTENGTVTPDAGYDGLSSVVVNVSGGGGGDVVLLSRAAWNALTTAEKRAYGLVAIQDAVTGFLRGELVNGADYIPLGIYLPYSNESDIICEAYQDNYDAANTEWGVGSNPIQLSAAGSAQNEDGSVTILTKTNGVLAYVDLGGNATVFTAYIVAKIRNSNGNFTRLLSCMASRSTGQGIMLYGTTVNVSSWASDTSTEISASAYFVGAIQFGGPGSALGSAIASASSTPTIISKSPSNAGRYLTIGRTDISADGNNAEPTDMDVLYLGVSSVAESQSVVTQNMQYLASQFLS